MLLQVCAGKRSGVLSLGRIGLNAGVGGKGANVLRKATGVAGVALGHRQPLLFVTCQQFRTGVAFKCAGQFPAQVHRVFDSGVVTQAAGGSEQMGGVPGQKYPSALHTLRSQGVSSNPCAHGQHLDVKINTQHLGDQLRSMRGAPVGRVFMVVQCGVHGKFILAVDRDPERSALRVEGDVHPGWVMRQLLVKGGAT